MCVSRITGPRLPVCLSSWGSPLGERGVNGGRSIASLNGENFNFRRRVPREVKRQPDIMVAPLGMRWATNCDGSDRCPCCDIARAFRRAGEGEVPALAAHVTGAVVDTHCHLHQSAWRAAATKPPEPVALALSLVLAVDERCWATVAAFCSHRRSARPGFGVHPWRAHELAAGWQERLRGVLRQHREALVGEIGLCKCAKNLRGPGAKARVWPLQVQAFADQLRVAAELHRPASVHCVKAHGTLLEMLQGWDVGALPPTVALHSFSGSAAQVHQLLKVGGLSRRLFFGFSHTVNVAMGGSPGSAGYEALLEAVRAVPEEQLLVESDSDDELTATHATLLAVQLVAEARGWTPERAAAITARNARRFLLDDHDVQLAADISARGHGLGRKGREGGGRRGGRSGNGTMRVRFELTATSGTACDASISIC